MGRLWLAASFATGFLSLLLSCAAPLVQAEEPVGGSGGTTLRLSGGVAHSDRLDPLPADERIGAAAPSLTPMPTAPNLNLPAPTPTAPNRNLPAQLQQVRQAGSLPKSAGMTSTLPQRNHALSGSAQTSQSSQSSQSNQSTQVQSLTAAAMPNSQVPVSPQASLKLLQQLNAHVSTAGSPLAPRPQILAPKPPVRLRAQGMTIQMQSANPSLDSMSIYKRNLQAIAAMDLQHSERNSALQAGIQRQNSAVKVEVPFWLAGEWQRSETNESSRIELPSGKQLKAVGKQKASVKDYFGTYKDKDGKIWMVVPLRNRGQVDRGFAIDRHQVNSYSLILTGKTSALVKVVASHTVVDKATHKVIQAYQDEELNAYSQVQDGLVKTESSVKVFDQMGNPKLLTRAVSMEKRIRGL